MANSIFDQLRDAAKRTAQDLDEKYDLKNKFDQGVTAANEAARKAGDKAGQAATVAREQFNKFDEEHKVTDNLRDTASKVATKTEETIKQGTQAAQTGAEQFSKVTEETAREVFGSAKTYYKRAEQAYNAGTAGARVAEAAVTGYEKTRVWVKDNPGKTAAVTFSMIAGIRAGSTLPDLGAAILGAGASGYWFFHSALPIVGIRKLTEKYNDYLKEQEKMLAEGKLDEAERGRIEFQRNMTKYVGAPLLGAFSVAAGASMIGAAFSGVTVTGFPVSLILGGNPLLNGIWFFANGVICISEGYKFFMIALADQEEVARVVREMKGLLPA
ncbi:MAG: hypothetical protein ABIU20_00680 [Blastocatellia bacterium]